MKRSSLWYVFALLCVSLLVVHHVRGTNPVGQMQLEPLGARFNADVNSESKQFNGPAGGGIAGSCPGTGSCFAAHATPGCNIVACCEAVCAQDPFCCDTQWDNICAGAAGVICTTCGGNGAGNCFAAHPNPSCNNEECCEAVCAQDAFCCNTQWDSICANAAGVICATCGGPGSGSCFAPHGNAACDNPTCCEAVCDQDPFCCDVLWDINCANAADIICSVCGGAGTGNCLEKQYPFEACNDLKCCTAVCAQDPFCCDAAWDFICVGIAEKICASCGGIAAGDCLSAHDLPACSDAECCEKVCAIDPFCCSVEWDNNCVNQAKSNCGGCLAADIAPLPDGNNVVNVDDLLTVINNWGPCADCPADIAPLPDGDNNVNVDDLLLVINSWGPCSP